MPSKACRKCGIEKSLDEFHTHARMADGHLHTCKVCHNAYTRERNKLRDPEVERDRLAAWRAAHPERWKEIRDRAQAKAQANGASVRSAETRRERVKSASGAVAIGRIALRRVLDRDGRHCGICDKPIGPNQELTFDHTIPLARGGEHTIENLRPAHRACNAWKRDRLPEELVGLTPPLPGEIDEWEVQRRAQANAVRSEKMRIRMAAMTPEQRAERGRKISEAKKGKPYPVPMRRPGRKPSAETISKRAEASRAKWASKTPAEREAWRARCREAKRGSPGNVSNLAKGWTPEVRAKAIEASATARRGRPQSEESNAKRSESLKRAYADGRRKPRG